MSANSSDKQLTKLRLNGGIGLPIWKAYVITFIEIIIFLVIGFILTENVLRVVYENSGIRFMGNVWVNWFGVSFLLFCLYTVFRGLLISKENILLKERMKSILFWLIFIGSVYAVFIPFLRGENPF